MNENIYQPPAAPLFYRESGEGEIPEAAINELAGTRPWPGLIGVISLLFAFIYVAGLFYISNMATRPGSREAAPLVAIAIVVFYLIAHPGIRLCYYGAAIKRAQRSRSHADFAEALRQQFLFWRFVGILTIVFAALMAVPLLMRKF